MKKDLKNIAYIDNTNLYKGSEAEGFKVDYIKFRQYLKNKHGVKMAYMFIDFVLGNEEMYKRFQEWGYTLIFKPTIPSGNGIKGNCDAELVLQATSDFYENKFDNAILVSSDGDFACLVKFLIKKNKFGFLLSPRESKKCSSLLKKIGTKIVFLPQIKEKISYKNENPPLKP